MWTVAMTLARELRAGRLTVRRGLIVRPWRGERIAPRAAVSRRTAIEAVTYGDAGPNVWIKAPRNAQVRGRFLSGSRAKGREEDMATGAEIVTESYGAAGKAGRLGGSKRRSKDGL